MAKPEIIPLAPEDREMVESVSRAAEERLETPSAPPIRPAAPAPPVEPTAEGDDIRTALVDVERLSLLAYVGVSILLNRFGVTDQEFGEQLTSVIEMFRRQRQPAPAVPEPPTRTEKETV